MIVVFGATGTVGGEVLRQLVERGEQVRAVTRSPDRAATLQDPAGAVGAAPSEVVVADLSEPGSLESAVRGADHVFFATPGVEEQPRLEGHLVDAVATLAPEAHVVKLAAMGYDALQEGQSVRFAGNHARVVGHIRDKGLRHTVVAPSGFMSNLLASAPSVREQGVVYGSAGDGGLGWVDPRDVAAVAVHVLTSPGHEGASYDVTGPEVLNHAQVAERMSQVLGREVRYVDVAPDQFEQSLRSVGAPAWNAAALTELYQLYRAHAAEAVTDEVQKATGRPPADVGDWLTRHREAFA